MNKVKFFLKTKPLFFGLLIVILVIIALWGFVFEKQKEPIRVAFSTKGGGVIFDHKYHTSIKNSQCQDAQGNTDLYPAGRIINHFPQRRRDQTGHNQANAFFDPDAQKEQHTGRHQYFRIVPAGVKRHCQGADDVHDDRGPDPRDQGRVTFEAEIQVNGWLWWVGR